MRLYAKLMGMILLFTAAVRWVEPAGSPRAWWFYVRCHTATVTGDDAMAERLVQEAQLLNREAAAAAPTIVAHAPG